MNKFLQSILTVFFLFFLVNETFAQVLDYPRYRTKQSGKWSEETSWQRKANASSDYVDAIAGQSPLQIPGQGNKIEILTGHQIELDAARSFGELTIAEGAYLYINYPGNGYTLNAQSLTASASAPNTSIVNNGFILSEGSDPTKIPTELVGKVKGSIRFTTTVQVRTFTISGTGYTCFGRMYMRANADGHLVVDKDITLSDNTAGVVTISAMETIVASRKATDNNTFTIKPGRVVTCTGTNSAFNNTLASSTTTGEAGNYIYNIDGTLDCSKLAASYVIPPTSSSTSTTTTTINIKGKFMMPAQVELGDVNQRIYLNLLEDGFVSSKRTLSNNSSLDFYFGSSGSSLSVTNKSGSSNNYEIAIDNADAGNGIDQSKSINHQWTILPSNTGSFDAAFIWPSSSQGSNFSATARLYRRAVGGTVWTDLGSVVPVVLESAQGYAEAKGQQSLKQINTLGAGTMSFQATGLTTGGIFVIGDKFTVAPIDLITFEEVKNVGNAFTTLKWTTVNEHSFSHFEIERSFDGKFFDQLAKVFSKSGDGIKEYTYTDSKFFNNVYYRLKAIDNDGQVSANRMITVDKSGGLANFTVSPNPVVNSFVVSTNKDVAIKSIKLLNAVGQVVFQEYLNKVNGQFSVSMTRFASGWYTVVVENSQGVKESKKLIKL